MSTAGHDDARRRLRAAATVRAAIDLVAADTFGGTVTREPVPGYQVLTLPVLDAPLAGVRAALLAHRVAFGQMREYAETARAAGHTWDDIAAALDLTDDPQDPVSGRAASEQAFEWLIEHRDPDPGRPPDYWSEPSAYWTCTTCKAQIRDRGPFEPHPDDRETEHEPDCARHQAAIRAYERQRDEDDS